MKLIFAWPAWPAAFCSFSVVVGAPSRGLSMILEGPSRGRFVGLPWGLAAVRRRLVTSSHISSGISCVGAGSCPSADVLELVGRELAIGDRFGVDLGLDDSWNRYGLS